MVQRFPDQLAPGAATGGKIIERRGHVIPYSEIFHDLLGLKRAPNTERGSPGHWNAKEVDTVDRHRASRAFDETAHDVEQRCLAGAVRPDQTGHSGADVGRQIIQSAHAAECDRQVANFNHSFRSIARGMKAMSLPPSIRASPTT